ncbi:MAG TPA: C2H2-type zinc finger protein [Thermoplasmata archaeon]|nr:C2H2-type zinc finger protein [Thermoplasmata archaeon]
MAEVCADCGASFGGPAELVRHMNTVHHGGDDVASLDMNPESHRAGLVCALCGKRFRSKEELRRHGLGPHYRARRAPIPEPVYYHPA